MAVAKKKMEDTIRDLTISVDNQNSLMKAAQTELSALDQKVGALQSRIAMAKDFQKKSNPSTSEVAYIKALPADEQALSDLKKEQADAKKRLGEIDRVLKREKPNLITAQKSLENFQSSLELIGIDFANLAISEPLQSETGEKYEF